MPDNIEISPAVSGFLDRRAKSEPEDDAAVALAEPKFTVIQVEGDCPKVLRDLGKQIATHLEKARKSEEKAEQHRIAAGLLLERAIESCDAAGFDAFLKKFCPDLGRSRLCELKSIAAGKKSLDEVRADTRGRVAKHRASKAASVTALVTDAAAKTTDEVAASATKSNVTDDAAASAETRKALYAVTDDDAGQADAEKAQIKELAEPVTLIAYWKRESKEARAAFLDAIGVQEILDNMSKAFGHELRARVPTPKKRGDDSTWISSRARKAKSKPITLLANPPCV
jgi:hypothetical protein